MTAVRWAAIVLLGLTLGRPACSEANPTEDLARLVARGYSDVAVERLAEYGVEMLVEALYSAEHGQALLEALIKKGDRRSAVKLLDFFEWQLANEPGSSTLTMQALAHLGDRRAAERLYRLLTDPGRPDQLRLAAARAVHRLGEPHEVADAHAFVLALHAADYESKRHLDLEDLIEALGEIGEDGQRALGEWLHAGTGFFSETLHILAQLLANPTPQALEILLRFADALDEEPNEPLVQLELLEHLLTIGGELDVAKAHEIATAITDDAISDEYVPRRDALVWRLKQRQGGRWIAGEPALETLDLENGVVVVTDQLLQEYLELEGWKIPELLPEELHRWRRKRSAGDPGLVDRLLKDSSPAVLNMLMCSAERLSFAPTVRSSLLQVLRRVERPLGVSDCDSGTGVRPTADPSSEQEWMEDER